MSDFDREAERERLREKYERDKAKREASERMSELLLQGATMTNRHCPECHSPVFRYDGREFCPTCQQEVGEKEPDDVAGEANGAETDDGASEGAGEAKAPDAGSAGVESANPEAVEAEPAEAEPAEADQETESSVEPEETSPAPTSDRRPARIDPPARQEGSTSDGRTTGDGNLEEAEAALVRQITALSRRAEETPDVGRKRDLFSAAREAAETLQAIRRL